MRLHWSSNLSSKAHDRSIPRAVRFLPQNGVLFIFFEPMEGVVLFGVSFLQDIHVLLSLAAIATGLVVVYGLITTRRMDGLTSVFLITTLLTNLTGFMFPFGGFTPALGVGIIGTVVITVCLVARYGRGLQGIWRAIYVVTAVLSLYLNVFVLIVQLFLKVPALNTLAPNGNEPPFVIAQALLLLAAIAFGWLAHKRFRIIEPALMQNTAKV